MFMGAVFGYNDKRYYLYNMNATKYDKVTELPAGAVRVSTYSRDNNISSPAYVQIKYNRFLETGKTYPGYYIVNWQGINFVVSGSKPQ